MTLTVPWSAIYFCGGALTGVTTMIVIAWLLSRRSRSSRTVKP